MSTPQEAEKLSRGNLSNDNNSSGRDENAEKLPSTPMTTMSALIGHCEAAAQESASRAAAEQSQAEVHVVSEKNKSNSNPAEEKTTSNIKRLFRNLTSSRKPPKVNIDRATRILPEDVRPEVTQTNNNDIPATNPESFHDTQDAQTTRTFDDAAYRLIKPLPECPQTRPVETSEQRDRPSHYPESPLHARSNTASYGMILGGQIARSNSQRVPSTYFTPTNGNSYAISGRSRFVPGRHVPSQQVEVEEAMAQTNPHPSAVVADTLDDPFYDGPMTSGNQLPLTASFDWPEYNMICDPNAYTSTTQAQFPSITGEARRSVSVPIDITRPTTLRGSAVPPPLNTHRNRHHFDAPPPAPTTQNFPIPPPGIWAPSQSYYSTLTNPYNQPHESSLEVRLREIENKLDRALSLLSIAVQNTSTLQQQAPPPPPPPPAGLPQQFTNYNSASTDERNLASHQPRSRNHATAAPAARSRPRPRPRHRDRQQGVRANLVAMPPHIPYGGVGLGEWYEAVSRRRGPGDE